MRCLKCGEEIPENGCTLPGVVYSCRLCGLSICCVDKGVEAYQERMWDKLTRVPDGCLAVFSGEEV